MKNEVEKLRELQLLYAESLRKNSKLEEENEKHRKRMSSLQYIEKGNTNHPEELRLNDKLVSMGLVTQTQMNNVLCQKKFQTPDGKECPWFHPDHKKLLSKLSTISRRISSAVQKNEHRYPLLRRRDRSNLYLLDDYRNYGDKIIEGYLAENPIGSWDVDWDWSLDEGYKDPFSPASSY